ncbi:hypothetical protein [Galbibacter mesophilus]|uniref:hypothetical protein n=1 Tax=Galbibacter mesophilus TaxID=379069 RepID=UPI00191FFBFF|nr:hypothetical protein [Galbibacter mesophilus]MCM5662807.1 hypothetical protein [Galbibacter mesophilus]
MNKFLILLILAFFLNSCKTQEEIIELKLKVCVNTEVQRFRRLNGNSNSKDIYISLLEIEDMLIKENFLQGKKLDSYKSLITNILGDVENQESLREIIERNFKDQLLELTYDPTVILIQCPQTILITEKNKINSTLNLQYETMNWLAAEEYKNKEAIDQLFSVTNPKDFDKIIYRVPFIYIILMNMQVLN